MSLEITVGSQTLTSFPGLKDLASTMKSDLHLGPEIESQLDQPLSTLPANLRSTLIHYDTGNKSWAPGVFTFTLSLGVTGKLRVMLAGDTFVSYTDTFPTDISIDSNPDSASNPPTTKTVPNGVAYVGLELDFFLSGGIAVNVPVGTWGIFGSADNQDTVNVAFYKQCQPTDTLRSAIAAAFAGFVLPLHPLTLNNLVPGDYLYHNFNAQLQLGFGASIGYSKAFYAGQSPIDIPGTGGAVTLDTSFIPTLQASATLSFTFSYTGTFEALLWKDDANTGHLHLFRSKEQDKTLGVSLGIGITSDPATSASNMSTQLGGFLGKFLPGSLGKTFINKVWPKATDEATNFASEGEAKLSGWLTPINNAQASLDFAIGSTNQSFLLLDYTFDLNAPAFAAAWKTAVSGDFVAALETPNGGVSIAVGGGLEKFHNRQTSITLNLFGQLQAAWTDAIISNSSMIYAGNNTFHLIANEGRQQLAVINGRAREIDLYFAAEADLSQPGVKLGDVDLHCILKATNNPKYGGYIANFLSLSTTGSTPALLTRSVAALARQPGTTQLLHLTFSSTAYGRLQASKITGGKPDNEAPDQQNYAAFAAACSNLFVESPPNFSYNNQSLGYTSWRNWNIASNDQWPAPTGSLPDRTQSGNSAAGLGYLNLEFPQAGLNAQLIAYALQAASDFMNFCADLQSLITFSVPGPELAPWDDLVGRLRSIIHNDVSTDFIAPAALALTRLCAGGRPPSEISGPVPGLTDQTSIAVTIAYS